MPHPATNPVIPLNRPEILESDIELVVETLRRGTLSVGPCLLEFEQLVAERTRRSFGVGVSSGLLPLKLHSAHLASGQAMKCSFPLSATAACPTAS